MAADPFRLIVCVHDLAETPVATGDEQRCWMPVSAFRPWLAQLDAAAAATGTPVELTSDDAFASDYADLLPLLVETGRTATFFVPTAFLGRPGRLTIAQLREMHALGMRIGTHGTDHLDWTKLNPAERRRDILGSIGTLEDLLGAPVTSAAPPFGAYDRATVALLLEHGITEIHTCHGGYAIGAGPLRTRVAIADDPAVNAGILALASRRPTARDGLRGAWHLLRGMPLAPRRQAARPLAVASAAS